MNSGLENIRVGDIIIASYGGKKRLCEVARKYVIGETFIDLHVYDDGGQGDIHSVDNQSVAFPTAEQIATFLAFKEAQKVYFACKAALLTNTEAAEKQNFL